MRASLRGARRLMTTPCCRGGARMARTSRPTQRSTRPRSAQRSCSGLRPSAPGKGVRFPGARRIGWAAVWLRST
eukprot:5204889-Alexandrium_andersonii.AAC.1